MTDTPLDIIIKKIAASDIVDNRLILFRRFLETELVILIDDPENPKPKLMQIDQWVIMEPQKGPAARTAP